MLGSIEYACAVAGAKLILVMGHTQCGAVTTAVNLLRSGESVAVATRCPHLQQIVDEIRISVDEPGVCGSRSRQMQLGDAVVDRVAVRNVQYVVGQIVTQSETIASLVREEKAAIQGAMYDVVSGEVRFLDPLAVPLAVLKHEIPG